MTSFRFATAAIVAVLLSVTGAAHANRLTDPSANRCVNDTAIPVEQCKRYADYAYYGEDLTLGGVPGCITQTEYNYAVANLIAPMCSRFDPSQFYGWCRCGCFKKGTRVLVSTKGGDIWSTIESLVGQESKQDMVTLAPHSTFSNLARDTQAISGMTVGPEEKPLVVIVTQNGRTIALTETHGVLLSNGKMARASELTTTDVLVGMDGRPEPIRTLRRAPTGDSVYNVLTAAGLENKPGHLIFAEHLIVGDLYWQNILEAELRELDLRN